MPLPPAIFHIHRGGRGRHLQGLRGQRAAVGTLQVQGQSGEGRGGHHTEHLQQRLEGGGRRWGKCGTEPGTLVLLLHAHGEGASRKLARPCFPLRRRHLASLVACPPPPPTQLTIKKTHTLGPCNVSKRLSKEPQRIPGGRRRGMNPSPCTADR